VPSRGNDLVRPGDGTFLQRDQCVQHLEGGCGGEWLLRAGFVVHVALAGGGRLDHQRPFNASLAEQVGDFGIFRLRDA